MQTGPTPVQLESASCSERETDKSEQESSALGKKLRKNARWEENNERDNFIEKDMHCFTHFDGMGMVH